MRRSSFLAAVLLSTSFFSSGCTPGESSSEGEPSLEPWVHGLQGLMNVEGLASGPDGDLLLGGELHGETDFGGGALVSAPHGSVFLAHLDAQGGHLMSGSTGSSDMLTSVSIGQDGSLFAAGVIDGAMSFGSGKISGEKDGYLTAFTPGGSPHFTRLVGGTLQVFIHRVAATPQGNVVIAGQADATTDLGNGPDSQVSYTQVVVAEYGPDGALLWSVRLSNTPATRVMAAVDRDGNVYLASAVYNQVELAGTTVDYGLFIAKIGPDGEPLWLLGASHEDGYIPSIEDIATDEDGNLYLSGFYYYNGFSMGGVSLPPSQQRNGYVVKLSPEGKGLYAKAFVTGSNDGDLEIAAAPGGDLLVGLTVRGAVDLGGGVLGWPTSETHAFLGRFGPDGEHRKSAVLSGLGDHQIWDIAADPKGHLVMTGTLQSILDLEGTHLVADTGGMAFLARTSF